MDAWTICIPSYRRPRTIQSKTLATLKRYQIPSECIYIFVADEQDKDIYEDSIPPTDYHAIVIARPGLAPARNFILDYFPRDTKLVMIDDDVTGFVVRTEEGKISPLPCLRSIIDLGFQQAQEHSACLWGVYPTPNGFFMTPNISYDLKFIVGSFWGIVNPGTEGMTLPYSEKEDYIRTLLAYERDGAVVRINYVSPKTSYYKEPGGMQEDPQRLQNQHIAVQYILERWPDKVLRNNRRKSPFPEILLRRRRS